MAGMQTMQPTSLEDMEREAIADALRRFRGNISKVAAELGVTRQTLYRKLEKYGIDR
jgi:transcriptional regulator of acetoin/glycerol metabolism